RDSMLAGGRSHVALTKAAPRRESTRAADDERPRSGPPGNQGQGRQGWQFNSSLGLTILLLLVVGAQGPVRRALSAPVMQSWMTVFVAVVVQALPFLVLGVLLSALLAVFVPPSFFARALPS